MFTCSCQVLVLPFSFSLPTMESLPLLPSPPLPPKRPDSIQLILYRQYMHELFHSFPPTNPSRVTTWWGVTSSREWCVHHTLWGGDSLTHNYIHSHIHVSGSFCIHYTMLCMWHTGIQTACLHIHRYIAGNETSAYSMHSTVCTVQYILYIVLIELMQLFLCILMYVHIKTAAWSLL